MTIISDRILFVLYFSIVYPLGGTYLNETIKSRQYVTWDKVMLFLNNFNN